jgi:hypothetical protein
MVLDGEIGRQRIGALARDSALKGTGVGLIFAGGRRVERAVQLRLRVRDGKRGSDPKVLNEDERAGHRTRAASANEDRSACLAQVRYSSFAQAGVLDFGLPVDGDVGVGVFPEGKKVLIRLTRRDLATHHCLRPG